MKPNDLNTALYEKMAAEQDKFRDWLKSQPPEEILHHTYEYTVREDIVMAMEELELTDTQAQALLESPSPLADVDNIRRIRNNNPADAAIRFRLLNHKNVKRRLCFFVR